MRTTRFPWLILNSTKRRTASRRWSRSLGGGCCAKNSSAENTVGSAIVSHVLGRVQRQTAEGWLLTVHAISAKLCSLESEHIHAASLWSRPTGRHPSRTRSPMLSPATRVSTRTVSHLVLAGYNPLAPPGRSAAAAAAPSSRQAVSNPSPAQVPLSTWLASVGRETDVERGYRIKHVAGGAGHQLVSYRNYEGFGTTPTFSPCGPRPR